MKQNGFFRKMADGYRRFLYGRYGQDALNRFISVLALALCLISFFVKSSVLYIIILILFALSMFRSLSKSFAKRRIENQMYEMAAKPVKRYFRFWSVRLKSGKTHRVFTCASCGSILRIPKDAARGKIEIKCPKCGASFTKRIEGNAK